MILPRLVPIVRILYLKSGPEFDNTAPITVTS